MLDLAMKVARSESQLFFDVTAPTLLQIRSTFVLPQ